MGKRRYNTLDEILEGYNAGDISMRSLDSMANYYRKKGNEDLSQLYKQAMKDIRKLNKLANNNTFWITKRHVT